MDLNLLLLELKESFLELLFLVPYKLLLDQYSYGAEHKMDLLRKVFLIVS